MSHRPARTPGEAAPQPGVDDARMLGWLRTMHVIRQFEDACLRLRSAGEIRGAVHPYSGQEAIATAVCDVVGADDWVASYYRCHGHAIARGVPLEDMLAEMLVREGALCRGHGGSMHLADARVRFLGGNAIVAGNLPIAAGLALAGALAGAGQTTVCFFGDGATGPGVFHETLLIAAAQRLPVVFVCENNGWQDLTPSEQVFPSGRLDLLAGAHGLPAERVDGNDAVAVHAVAARAVARARGGDGPSFVECVTHLRRFHAQTFDEPPADYVPAAERQAWEARDPIDLLTSRLLGRGVPRQRLRDVRAGAEAAVRRAVREVRRRPPLPAGPAPAGQPGHQEV